MHSSRIRPRRLRSDTAWGERAGPAGVGLPARPGRPGSDVEPPRGKPAAEVVRGGCVANGSWGRIRVGVMRPESILAASETEKPAARATAFTLRRPSVFEV